MMELRATLRLQLHKDFTLDDARLLVPYFAQLGVSHLYTSPLLTARPGSTHGYDVVDPTQVNPELGGEAALERLVEALRNDNMGLICDLVPNHMAVGGNANPWWLDVLKWGPSSPYAHFFDIQWNSHDPLMKGQLLVPFLRTDYAEVLASGEVTLHFDSDTGTFFAAHYDHHFPLTPSSYADILRRVQPSGLADLIEQFANLDEYRNAREKAQRLCAELRNLGRHPTLGPAITAALEDYDGRHPEGFKRLHQLLEAQHYRIASWRTAADDINWRRFFDINDLGALRVERPDVFEATHAKIFELIERGWIDGLRIDHVDGLANPRSYCRKLRRRLDYLQHRRPGALAQTRLPIFVEKILGDGEHLPPDWLVDGTTGYEFMNQVSLLQHDPLGEFQLYDLWARISGRSANFLEEVRAARELVLSSSLVGDFEMIAQGLLTIARMDLATRDLTLGAIRRALFELVVHFTVYRTYAGACGRSEQDEYYFQQALTNARSTLGESDWPLLDHLNRWLGGQPLRAVPPGKERQLRKQILTRFQQLTSPAAAKAVEDTACYRSAALLSRNDVGFDPQHFSAPLTDFHNACSTRAQRFPGSMITTATHDHKRGEDTRARLAVISERPVWFSEKISQWMKLAASLRTELEDGIAPSPADELMLYQTLLGTWPLQLTPEDPNGLQEYLERLQRWQEKALREAKLRTNWSAPNETYESACRQFLTQLLQSESTDDLRRDIAAAALALAPAGALNSLTQCCLRLTVPGVPDLYQGTEFWDFSLVDPDNRAPVDYDQRQVAFAVEPGTAELISHWRDGRIKQWLIARILRLRAEHPQLFSKGRYLPLTTGGAYADRVIAFAREHHNQWLVVVAPRLTVALLGDHSQPLISADHWDDTYVQLPADVAERQWHSVCSSAPTAPGDRLVLSDALKDFPLNLFFS